MHELKQIHVVDFAAARRHELEHMLDKVVSKGGKITETKRHRRRRTNAHHSYRMPVRRRMPQLSSPESTTMNALYRSSRSKNSKKKIVRKARRQPARIYAQQGFHRSRHAFVEDLEPRPMILPTHFWHVKRMKMETIWGFKLAQHRLDQSIGAALKAHKTHCTLYDASHTACLRIRAKEPEHDFGASMENIISRLQPCLDPVTAHLILRKGLRGHSENQFLLYHRGSFPFKVICPVSFSWQSSPVSLETVLTLWIHPSAFEEAFDVLQDQLITISGHSKEEEEKEPPMHNENQIQIEMEDCRGEFCRLQLRGTQARALVRQVLITPELGKLKKNQMMSLLCSDVRENTFVDDSLSLESSSHSHTFSDLEQQDEDENSNKILCPVTGQAFSVDHEDQVVSHCQRMIDQLDLWSKDPEQHYPVSFTSRQSLNDARNVLPTRAAVATTPSDSMLWDRSTRESLAKSYCPDHILNAKQHDQRKSFWHSFDKTNTKTGERTGTRFPMLVIGQSNGGLDVVISPERVVNVWTKVTSAGARAIGRHEAHALDLHEQRLSFPQDFPDSASGTKYWHDRALDREEGHLSKPKAKQVPYARLRSLDWAFEPQWQHVFSSDEPLSRPFCILRGHHYAAAFSFLFKKEQKFLPIRMAVPTLAQVVIEFPTRGCLAATSTHAMICAPTSTDVCAYSASMAWKGTCESPDDAGREPMGFVTNHCYNRSNGKKLCIGFCNMESLQSLFLTPEDESSHHVHGLAMLRDPASLYYRPILLKVVI